MIIKKSNTLKLTIAAMLTAVAIVIPMIMPVRVVLEPASFTLASHVPIFLAMFFSPGIALAVSLGSAIGFLLASFPIVIVLRALSHVIFAYLGAKYLVRRREEVLDSPVKSAGFSFVTGCIHGISEMLVVSLFFFGLLPGGGSNEGYLYTVFVLVGVGTVIHSMIDFLISQFVWKSLGSRAESISNKVNL